MLDYTADQARFRRDVRLSDQFNREWDCSIEIATGCPCSPVTPHGWDDPLNTPTVYLVVPVYDDGAAKHGKIEVAFDKWILDVEINLKHWNMAIQMMGEKKFPLASADERELWPTNPHLTVEAGPMPKPSLETLIQAKNGDKGLLGLRIDAETKSVFPDEMTYKEFLAENRVDEFGNKRTITQMAPMWKEHKANLEGDEVKDEEVEKEELEKVEA